MPKQVAKVCKICGQDFISPMGNFKTCSVECSKENRKRLHQAGHKRAYANPEKRQSIKDRSAAWRKANPKVMQAHRKKWAQNNKGLVNTYSAAYRANKKQATPTWADNKEILKIYRLASKRNLAVDHIVPLTSEYVCGLHTPDNLRCISKELNERKSNKYWSDM